MRPCGLDRLGGALSIIPALRTQGRILEGQQGEVSKATVTAPRDRPQRATPPSRGGWKSAPGARTPSRAPSGDRARNAQADALCRVEATKADAYAGYAGGITVYPRSRRKSIAAPARVRSPEFQHGTMRHRGSGRAVRRWPSKPHRPVRLRWPAPNSDRVTRWALGLTVNQASSGTHRSTRWRSTKFGRCGVATR